MYICLYVFVHIYIYIFAVKLKAGPRFGGVKVKTGPSLKLKTGPIVSLFFPIFIVFFGIFENANSVTLCQNSVFAIFWGCQKWGFRKENCTFCFCLLYVEPYKNSVFWRWSCENVKNQKKWIFSKNCLTLFVSGREEQNAHFRAHSLFWPKMFFGPKQCKPGKTIKIVVSAEIAQNQKWHLFFENGVFWHGWKSGFY